MALRLEDCEGTRPQVLSVRTIAAALVVHVALFLFFWVCAKINFRKEEEIIPIDLTVIVNENLDGEEGKPPPLKNPTPEPPKPKPKPQPKPKEIVKKPDPPKALEQIVTNVVVKVEKTPPKVEKPPKEEKKPEPPKKTKKQLEEERLKRMRDSAKVVNKPVKIEVKNASDSANGRTARQTMTAAEIQKLLDQGYRPGTQNQLAASDAQRCVSLVQRAIEETWDRIGPRIGREGDVYLTVQFDSNGGLTNVRVSRSCGDKVSDSAAVQVAKGVRQIPGLSPSFRAAFAREPLTIRYHVRAR